jgi:drug/metabolite transporter (DMT)-like permease
MSNITTPQAPVTIRAAAPAALVWTALGIVYVVWGSTYLGIRVAVQAGLPPLVSGGVRFIAAGLLLATAIAVRRGINALRVSRRQLAATALAGALLLVGGNGLVMVAEQTVPSGLAALMIAGVPLWIVVLRRLTGDRPSRATLLGVLAGLAGLAVLSLPDSSTTGAGAVGIALLVLAPIFWASGSFLSSRVSMPQDPFVATVWEMLAGGAAMAVAGAARGELAGFSPADVRSSGWLALGYLTMFGAVGAFTSYVWLLQNARLSLVSTYAYVNPIVAVFLGALLLDEVVTWPILLGGAIVVLGVGIVVSTERPRPA